MTPKAKRLYMKEYENKRKALVLAKERWRQCDKSKGRTAIVISRQNALNLAQEQWDEINRRQP